ncbi:MAG: Co2+/Mg2+ efflux protein ApaG [Candidatus Paracaedibacteraceae bacterium]|nr:Co2+/Mg2+ efflux protein ApaG [Candidatus Paracaedibacteraceae bacterium]
MTHKNFTYSSKTKEICVTVQPFFLQSHSLPEKSQFMWSYHIQIENHGDAPYQLINRFWHITDGNGQVKEVSGEGVIGEKPILNPGELFEYTSGTPLHTPSGFMSGYYEMETPEGDLVKIEIPTFSLDSPFANTSVH